MVKKLPANAGDVGLIPGLRRISGEGNDNPLLAWEIPWTKVPGGLHTVHGVSKSWTRLSD